MKLSREEFEKTNYKMSYDKYCKCYCPDCERESSCPVSQMYLRLPRVDGGLGLCPKLDREVLIMKKKFEVTITRTGSIIVEAETANEAFDKVFDMTTADIDRSADGNLTGWEPSDVEEIED